MYIKKPLSYPSTIKTEFKNGDAYQLTLSLYDLNLPSGYYEVAAIMQYRLERNGEEFLLTESVFVEIP